MSAHTPGPWSARQEFANRWRIERTDSGFAPVSVAIVTRTILEVGSDDGSCEANARLIAAAPETAAERDRLRAILAVAEDGLGASASALGSYEMQDSQWDGVRDAIKIARAAIAKAEGHS